MKKYSVTEIQRMRTAVGEIIGAREMGTAYRRVDRDVQIEHVLQTYLIAEMTPEELEAAAEEEEQKLLLQD